MSVQPPATTLGARPAGASEVGDALFRAYFDRLTAYARRRGAQDPEAVASDVLTAAIARPDRLDPGDVEQCSAYLHRAVHNRVIDEYRRRSRVLEVELPAPTSIGAAVFAAPDASVDVEADAGFAELVDGLTPAQRDVVVHRFVGGYSTDETAALVGRSPSAVRRLQHDAIGRLRLILAGAAIVVVAVLALALLLSRDPDVLLDTDPVTTDDGSEQDSSPLPPVDGLGGVLSPGASTTGGGPAPTVGVTPSAGAAPGSSLDPTGTTDDAAEPSPSSGSVPPAAAEAEEADEAEGDEVEGDDEADDADPAQSETGEEGREEGEEEGEEEGARSELVGVESSQEPESEGEGASSGEPEGDASGGDGAEGESSGDGEPAADGDTAGA